MRRLFIVLLVALVSVCHVHGANFGAMMKKENALKIHKRRGDWTKSTEPCAEGVEHTVHIAINQKNLNVLEEKLYDVSNPSSANYGKHWTHEQVGELVRNQAATDRVVNLVKKGAAEDGITSQVTIETSLYGEYVSVTAPTSFLSSFLDSSFFTFTRNNVDSTKDTSRVIRTADQYSLPESIHFDVHTVFNTIQLPAPSQQRATTDKARTAINVDGSSSESSISTTSTSSAGVGVGAGEVEESATQPAGTTGPAEGQLLFGLMTPARLYQTYNITGRVDGEDVTQAVFETGNQTYSPSDLNQYLDSANISHPANGYIEKVVGGHASDAVCMKNSNQCGEANLDVQILTAIAQANTTYWYSNSDQSFTQWILAVANSTSPPDVFSISYGSSEFYMDISTGNSFNTEAMKLGLKGVTILASSGDDGVAGPGARSDASMCLYNPQFPASSPYVTAVGGTQGPESNKQEVVCASDAGGLITSGGGFSSMWNRPSWQKAATEAYFRAVPSNKAPQQGYSVWGRGYPDVSMPASSYQIYIAGKLSTEYGTSASSPAFAGLVTLVNAARVRKSKPKLGWINPTLYAFAENHSYKALFKDVTGGNNQCCAGSPGQQVCCSQGFEATSGWDPATGWGTVNYGLMEDAFMKIA